MLKKQQKKVKVWATISPEIWKRDNIVLGKIFNNSIKSFSEAVFLNEEDAQRYAKRFSRLMKMIVVPCTITYTLPSKTPNKK